MHQHTHTQSECLWGICICVGAGKGARPPAAKPSLPCSLLVSASLPLCLHSLMPKGIFSSLCQSIMKVHSTSKGISRGVLGYSLGGLGPNLVFPGWHCWVQGGSRETLGCVRLKVRAGNKKIGVNYYSPHGFPKESGSSSLRPVFLFDGGIR